MARWSKARMRHFRSAMCGIGFGCISAAAGAEEAEQRAAPAPPSAPPAYVPPGPPGQPPPITGQSPAPSAVDARFEPDEPDLQLLSLSAEMPYQHVEIVHYGWWRPRGYYMGFGLAPIYAPLCDGPCNLRLMKGPYHLALSKAGGPPVPVEGGTVIGGPSTMLAHYLDRSGTRTAGAVIGIVGTIGGLVMIMSSIHEDQTCDAYGYCYRHDKVNDPLLFSGIGLFVGSAVASSIMLWQRDEAKLSIAPLRMPNASRTPRDQRTPLALLAVSGAAVTISY